MFKKVSLVLVVAIGLFSVQSVQAVLGDVGIYTAPAKSFSTASYWIEGREGVVLIDTQFLPKEGIAAVELKFNGTYLLQQRGIKVITSAQVAALIPAVHAIRWSWFGVEYAPDYPKDAAKPEVFGDRSVDLVIDGLAMTLHVLGKGASGAHVVAQYKESVFVGDLINPNNHAWLELGYIGEWLTRLEEVRGMRAATVYPGRGQVGGAGLIQGQADYLKQVRQWVHAEFVPGEKSELSWLTKQRLQRKIESTYPQLGYPIFMRDGLPAVWKNEQK
jgi:Metallo-beta-lactamase superfamily